MSASCRASPLREFYQYGGWTDYRLTNTKSIEERAWTVLSSIPERYNSCCAAAATSFSSGRSRQPAIAPINQPMTASSDHTGCIERAWGQRRYPSKLASAFRAFGGRYRTPESKNRITAVGLSGLSGLSGVLAPPSLKIEGGGGVRARVGLSNPRKRANAAGDLDE